MAARLVAQRHAQITRRFEAGRKVAPLDRLERSFPAPHRGGVNHRLGTGGGLWRQAAERS